MDEFELARLLEKKKNEKIKKVKGLKERDVVEEIKNEIENYKKKGNKEIFIFYGLRGIGKTTALLQSIGKNDGMYLDGDLLRYFDVGVVEVVEEYLRNSKYDVVYIDEVNSIPKWEEGLKVLYDNYDLKIIATGSSAIKINLDKSKIIRRAKIKEIPPLTFKEFLRIKYGENIEIKSKDVFKSSPQDAYIKAKAILFKLKDYTKEFREYMRRGIPFIFDIEVERGVDSLITKIIADDFAGIEGFNLETTRNARKIIESIAISKPSHISLHSFSKITGSSKTTISNILNAFVMSSLLVEVSPYKKGFGKIRKEKKYLFSSPSIRFGLSSMFGEENIGGMREDAFVSSMKFAGFNVEYLKNSKNKSADYIVNGLEYEIGGKRKGEEQVGEGFILVDGNKIDYQDKVVKLPLFLVGFV